MAEKHHAMPVIPFGAVYFRKSNPPREDWERDYRAAAADGWNAFRHWFMWSAIEVAPGEFDWEEYDAHLDLAAKYGLKTIIAEVTHAAPEWAFHQYAHCRYERQDGTRVESRMRNSSVTGGYSGLCLDNPQALALAENWLRALVNRYRDHPGLGGYDVWNETNLLSSAYTYCYCEGTQQRFREWLQHKYGDLKTLGKAWFRYSYTDWDQVYAPRQTGAYPDFMDWVQFRVDNAYRLFKWRIDLIRELDSQHLITAHGVTRQTLERHTEAADDEWRAAALVDIYGGTYGQNYGSPEEAWKGWCALDLTRSACQGKDFWQAEASTAPSWLPSSRMPAREDRFNSPEDARVRTLLTFAAGARGLFFSRWRPLLDGPLFGAYGPGYGLNGERTAKSDMVASIAHWVQQPEQEKLWQSRPIAGELALLFVPESEIHCVAHWGSSDLYAKAAEGAYQAFLDNNIQAEWCKIEQIDQYKMIYLPFPLMLPDKTVAALMAWVERGGKLVSDGAPGYFDERVHAGAVQPWRGLDRLLGVRQAYVEFFPDLLENLALTIDNRQVAGGAYMQSYQPTTAQPVGWYEDGQVAAVDHSFGQGKVRLLGSAMGYGYTTHRDAASRAFFADLLPWAGITAAIKSSEWRVTARLHAGEGGVYLWVMNPMREDLPVTLELASQWGPFSSATVLWGESVPQVEGRQIRLTAGQRDVLVARLDV